MWCVEWQQPFVALRLMSLRAGLENLRFDNIELSDHSQGPPT